MKSYDNLIEALSDLKKEGYVEDFNLKQNCIECRNGMYRIFHDEFNIDNYFRFEDDDSSPDNSAILYAVTSEKYNLKGTLINSFSIYSNEVTDEMLNKLKFTN
ncbi:phosphoribosylpyrophosphate synthetase [Algoriphagus sp. NG3]|uniref:phosphoribosylpyrophosphate synthetase n=1 Tax=Algoriphagus sp. NG3 TaxID=3097546 RepID=UPI002A81AD17|nr:phosphoribosylpyrophosphate synthetase [Algoriphagus sp. NG3]WPR77282.1 phosphoribosylpyrophosphate synthetase [Algoriphagus sp. NG3]